MLTFLIISLLAGAAVVVFWDEISNTVSAWLRENGYEESWLMRAWVVLDNTVSAIRSRVYVRLRNGAQEEIQERCISRDQLDPETRAMLDRSGRLERTITL